MVRPMPELASNHHHYPHLCHSTPLAPIGLFLAITALIGLCAHHRDSTNSKKTAAAAIAKPKHYPHHGSRSSQTADIFPTDNTKESSTRNYTAIASSASKDTTTTAVSTNTTTNQRTPDQLLKDPPRSPLRSALMSPLRSPLIKSPMRRLLTTVLSDNRSNHKTRRLDTSNIPRRATHYDKQLEALFYDGFTSDDDEEIDQFKGYVDEEGVWQKNILMGDKCRPLEFSGVIYYDDSGNKLAHIPRSPRPAAVKPPSPHRSFSFPVAKN